MQKSLLPTALRSQTQASFRYKEYFEKLEPGIQFEDIFAPNFWRHHNKGGIAVDDIIRMQAYDRSFDVFVTVAKKTPSGLLVEYMGGRPPANTDPLAAEKDAIAKSFEIKTVPLWRDNKPVVRVEHLPKTKWRVLGLEKREIQRNIETKEEAERCMAKYLDDMRLRMPSEAEVEQMRAERVREPA